MVIVQRPRAGELVKIGVLTSHTGLNLDLKTRTTTSVQTPTVTKSCGVTLPIEKKDGSTVTKPALVHRMVDLVQARVLLKTVLYVKMALEPGKKFAR